MKNELPLMGTILVLGALVWFNPGLAGQLSAVIGRRAVPKVALPTPTQAGGDLTYTRLVQQYQNARIQFDRNCQTVPTVMSARIGMRILLDNRSNKPHTVTLGAATYSLPSYGYQVVTISSQTSINCDSSVNVGNVQVTP